MVHVFLLNGASPRRVVTRWARKIGHTPSHGNSMILAILGQVGKLPKCIARTKAELASPDQGSERDTGDASHQRSSNRLARPELEAPPPAADAASRISTGDQALRQRENALKDFLVRTPDAAVEAAEIIALDRIEIPETDDLPPLRQLVTTAMAKRPDVAVV